MRGVAMAAVMAWLLCGCGQSLMNTLKTRPRKR